ncbi:MAG: hypothetical protein R6W78_03770 [Bacteroidales bacterium]
MRHYITITLTLVIGCLSAFSQQSDYMIKGEVISCTDSKDKPGGYIYLYHDSKPIDSVWTYHQTLFGDIYWTNGKFKFKGLQNGSYQIRYETYFDTQDFPTFEINGADLKGIEICFDKLPERLYKEKTSLDRLKINDTLFINVYIASGGEFGGYDEGFWIIKEQNGFVGRFYRLPTKYSTHRDTTEVIRSYKNYIFESKPISENIELKENDLELIRRFMVEVKHYQDDYISNATEHILIWNNKNDMIYRIKNNSHFQPYLRLKDRIINGL